jgi:hypothetical protein
MPPLRIPEFFLTEPGAAINAAPFEAESFINFTGPPGSMTGLIYSVYFQLGKWGFQTHKVDEWIDVSPVFKQYYDITIQQRQALESQIKAGLAQIANAIHDYELVAHDLRKYKEFLDYFTKVEKGKEFIKLKKAAEEGKKILKEGDQTLKAVFIDEVDVHTGEGIALKLIAPRWPTIIADFMRIEDEDTDPEKISKKLKVSEAEGVVLATKNKLYVEWRDRLFKPTILDRYQRISRLTEARKASIKEYSSMLRPVITRFRLISDALESKEHRALVRGHPLIRTDAQAYSMDFIRMWAWRPFSPTEKYKMTREIELNEIPATKAGFSREEIKYLTELIKKKSDTKNLSLDEELLLNSGRVKALPIDGGGGNGYSIDKIVRRYAGLTPGFKGQTVQKEYGVTIDIRDVFEARTRLTTEFSRRAAESAETELRETSTGMGVKRGSAWVFSPYFVFLDVPLLRGVFKLPNGFEMEDLEMENLRTATKSQNVIIVHLLEVIAREKQLENYIGTLLGEVEGEKFQSIEDLSKEQYPEVFGKLEKLKSPTEGGLTAALKKIRASFGDVLRAFGLTNDFVDWTRARGPYEFALDDRITEVIQPDPGGLFKLIVSYMQQAAGVPGVKW